MKRYLLLMIACVMGMSHTPMFAFGLFPLDTKKPVSATVAQSAAVPQVPEVAPILPAVVTVDETPPSLATPSPSVSTFFNPKQFTIFAPLSQLQLTRNDVQLKGVNRLDSLTFVNGKVIKMTPDGRFLERWSITQPGKHTLLVSFFSPFDQAFDHRLIRINRLTAPMDLHKVPETDRDYLLGFANSDFIPTTNREKSLADPLSRLELAYFVYQLISNKNDAPAVGADWQQQAIRYVTQNHIMASYPDGQFRPTESVKTTEYIITLVRALKLEIPTDTIKLPYTDVDTGHWTARYVDAAYNAGMLPPSGTLRLNAPLRRDLFMTYAAHISPVRAVINRILSFDDGFSPTENVIAQYESIWQTTYLANQAQLNTPFVVTWTSPKFPTETVYHTDKVVLRGKMTPAMAFSLNGQPVMPAPSGEFAFSLGLRMGMNPVTIVGRNNQKTDFSLLRLPNYVDLKGHWISGRAAELALIGAWPDTASFKPKMPVTRGFLAEVLKMALSLPQAKDVIAVSDVDEKSSQWANIQAVLSAGLMQTTHGQFRPDEVMNRAGVITALSRTLPEQSAQTTANFTDVPPSYWGYPYVQKAFHAGLISEARFFYPLNEMTRAELAAVVYKLPGIQARIAQVLTSP